MIKILDIEGLRTLITELKDWITTKAKVHAATTADNLSSTLTIEKGGTGKTKRADALGALAYLGLNPIDAVENDTHAKWSELGLGQAYFTESRLQGQPSTAGYLINIKDASADDIYQIWLSSTAGRIYTRIATSGTEAMPSFTEAGKNTVWPGSSSQVILGNGSVQNISSLGKVSTATTADKLGGSTIGGANQPIYLSSGTPAASTSTIGSSTTPIYLSNGVFTSISKVSNASNADNATNATNATYLGSSSSSIGSGTKPVYLSSGKIVASSSTVGSASQPVYLSNGTLTAGNSIPTNTDVNVTQNSSSGNAAYPLIFKSSSSTSNTTTNVSFNAGVTVNPYSGTITATIFNGKLGSSTIGSSTKPIYLSGGTPTASTSTIGSSTKPVYLSSGTITACSGTVGSSSKPVYMNAGVITACTSITPSWPGTSSQIILGNGTAQNISTFFSNNATALRNAIGTATTSNPGLVPTLPASAT